MISIVIPAHNEEQVIGRLLEGVTRGAGPGELEIVVVTNGCTDRTAEVAGSFPGVTVVDSPVASKPAALNLGDATAKSFPRMYLDADIEVDIAAVRAVGDVLRVSLLLACGAEQAGSRNYPQCRCQFRDHQMRKLCGPSLACVGLIARSDLSDPRYLRRSDTPR